MKATTKRDAYRRASELCDALGDPWEPVVFDNVGWVWYARIPGVASIHPRNDGTYYASVGEPGTLAMFSEPLPMTSTAVEAVAAAARSYRRFFDAFVAEQTAILEPLERYLETARKDVKLETA